MNFGIPQRNKGEPTEEQVGAVHDPPADKTTDGCQVDQPAEHGCSAVGNGHEGQEGGERLLVHSLSLRPTVSEQNKTHTKGNGDQR